MRDALPFGPTPGRGKCCRWSLGRLLMVFRWGTTGSRGRGSSTTSSTAGTPWVSPAFDEVAEAGRRIRSFEDNTRVFTSLAIAAEGFHAATYQTLIGLLAASGLRIGEAIKLDLSDIDWDQGVLLIRESKFGKSRLVPLHPNAMQALDEHAQLGDERRKRDPARESSGTSAHISASRPHRPPCLTHRYATTTDLNIEAEAGRDHEIKASAAIPTMAAYEVSRSSGVMFWEGSSR